MVDLRVDEQDSERKIELGEFHSKVDDDCQDHKIETHYASMHMDEEYATNIVEREAGASICEANQEHIMLKESTVICMIQMIVNPTVMRLM